MRAFLAIDNTVAVPSFLPAPAPHGLYRSHVFLRRLRLGEFNKMLAATEGPEHQIGPGDGPSPLCVLKVENVSVS